MHLPARLLTSALVAALTLSVAAVTPAAASTSIGSACPSTFPSTAFSDVAATGAHTREIGCLASWQIATGFSDGTFRPTRTATRAEFAAFLYRLLVRTGRTPADGPQRFDDVPAGHPDARAINALAAAGVISGKSATLYAPSEQVTRGQMASLVVRANEKTFNRPMPLAAPFPDTIGSVHETPVRKLVGAGITVGFSDGTYRPGVGITRAQTSTFLTRYLNGVVADKLAPLAPAPATPSLCHIFTPVAWQFEGFFNSLSFSRTVLAGSTLPSCRLTEANTPGVTLDVCEVSLATFTQRKGSAGALPLWYTHAGSPLNFPVSDHYGIKNADIYKPQEIGFVYKGKAYQAIYADPQRVNNSGQIFVNDGSFGEWLVSRL
jgi:hypothetical protein